MASRIFITMSPINLCLLFLGACCAFTSVIAQEKDATSGAQNELVQLVSRLRFELRTVEPKSKRCREFLLKMEANEPVRLLLDEQTKGDNTQASRLLAASSMLKQQATKLTSLVAYVEDCAGELNLDQEQAGDAGAQLEAQVKRLSEANEALRSELVKLRAEVSSLSEAKEASERNLASCGQKLHELEAHSSHCESEAKELRERHEVELKGLRAELEAHESSNSKECQAETSKCQAELSELKSSSTTALVECKGELKLSGEKLARSSEELEARVGEFEALEGEWAEKLGECRKLAKENEDGWQRCIVAGNQWVEYSKRIKEGKNKMASELHKDLDDQRDSN